MAYKYCYRLSHMLDALYGCSSGTVVTEASAVGTDEVQPRQQQLEIAPGG